MFEHWGIGGLPSEPWFCAMELARCRQFAPLSRIGVELMFGPQGQLIASPRVLWCPLRVIFIGRSILRWPAASVAAVRATCRDSQISIQRLRQRLLDLRKHRRAVLKKQLRFEGMLGKTSKGPKGRKRKKDEDL